jgi:hypothetical protein
VVSQLVLSSTNSNSSANSGDSESINSSGSGDSSINNGNDDDSSDSSSTTNRVDDNNDVDYDYDDINEQIQRALADESNTELLINLFDRGHNDIPLPFAPAAAQRIMDSLLENPAERLIRLLINEVLKIYEVILVCYCV